MSPPRDEWTTEAPLLRVRDLVTTFRPGRRGAGDPAVQAVRGVSFEVGAGQSIGVVGESGSGKSVTALSLLRLLPDTAVVQAGQLALSGQSIATLSPRGLRDLRGQRIAMVFQDPMTSLNPLMPVGRQIEEMLVVHHSGLGRAERRRRVIELLERVRIPEPARRYHDYPHQFSGGMRQRALIAMAIALRPALLIADEPTTALDVTIQDQILRLLRQLQVESATSILLITHDLAVVAGLCSQVIVMYGGLIMEQASVADLFARPLHPYTMGLLASLPALRAQAGTRLESIPGTPPDMTQPPPGCPFAPRCRFARVKCALQRPGFYSAGAGHRSACWLLDRQAPATDSPFGGADGPLRRGVVPLP
jgi:oligopeptide transport system ATP-binding protein